jgi:hypothetical protein
LTLTGSVTEWSRWVDGRRPFSLPAACAWLLVAVLLAYAVIGAIAGQQHGAAGWTAAAVAAGICWLAQTLSMIATSLTRGPLRGLYSLVYGLAFGFAGPFAAGLILSRRVPQLADAGVFGLIVAFYLVTLAVGTLLTVRLIAQAATSKSSETGNG